MAPNMLARPFPLRKGEFRSAPRRQTGSDGTIANLVAALGLRTAPRGKASRV